VNPLATKTGRTAAFYVLLGALAFGVSRMTQLAKCTDWRLAALRELDQHAEPAFPGAADVLFLGSSRTVRGVMPKAFADEWAALTGGTCTPRNLAVNGTPRHVNYLQLVDWLERHPVPETVFVEVGVSDLVYWPHVLLPRFIDARDALRLVTHRPYYSGTSRLSERVKAAEAGGASLGLLYEIDRFGRHVEMALGVLGRGPEDCARALFNVAMNVWEGGAALDPYWSEAPPISEAVVWQQVGELGWYRIPTDTPEYARGLQQVAEKAARLSIEEANSKRRQEVLEGAPRYRPTVLYTRLIAELCAERGIRCVFMFQPGFREELPSESQVAFYESLGAWFMPDMAELQRQEYYADVGHLTEAGAELYSRALARFLAADAKTQ
jgi:hypothetical protein